MIQTNRYPARDLNPHRWPTDFWQDECRFVRGHPPRSTMAGQKERFRHNADSSGSTLSCWDSHRDMAPILLVLAKKRHGLEQLNLTANCQRRDETSFPKEIGPWVRLGSNQHPKFLARTRRPTTSPLKVSNPRANLSKSPFPKRPVPDLPRAWPHQSGTNKAKQNQHPEYRAWCPNSQGPWKIKSRTLRTGKSQRMRPSAAIPRR